MINMLLLMIAAHFLFDFAGQGDFMARAKNPQEPIKGVPWQWALVGHAWIHAALVGLITGSTILGAAEFIVHASTDYLKGKGELTFSQDQTIHVGAKVVWMVGAWALMRAGVVW